MCLGIRGVGEVGDDRIVSTYTSYLLVDSFVFPQDKCGNLLSDNIGHVVSVLPYRPYWSLMLAGWRHFECGVICVDSFSFHGEQVSGHLLTSLYTVFYALDFLHQIQRYFMSLPHIFFHGQVCKAISKDNLVTRQQC